MKNKKNIAINGKFLSVAGTGVQRVAEEMIVALDQVLQNDKALNESMSFELIAPKNVTIDLALQKIVPLNQGLLSGLFKNNLWEQFNLPSLSSGKTILSLCNISPIFSKNAVVMMHDAQVYASPKSYTRGFRLWYKFCLPRIGLMAKKIITVSEYSKNQLVEFGVANAEKIHVIHNGGDHILRKTADNRVIISHELTNKPFVVAQANTQAHKNIQVLLQAFSSSNLHDVRLVLYGSATKQDFERMGIAVPANVIFTGRITDGELRALLEAALATLTPSLTEGFGLQPIEGMMLACPAIVAPCGALPEVCGDVGLYADPHQPEAWVKAIRYLLDEKEFTQNLRQHVVKHAQQFTWENAAKKLIALLSV